MIINNNIINYLIKNIYNKLCFLKLKLNINKLYIFYSGGVDSTFLLHIIKKVIYIYKIDIDIIAIHVNHNLNNKSELYLKHCIKECNIFNIKLIIKDINITNEDIKNFGIEKACRLIRYKCIKNLIKKKEILLTAHNKNDQVETFLLFINRGSSLTGLSCIKEINFINKYMIFRPILDFCRKDILYYINKFNINFINDISNNDINIYRNFIRKKVIPCIEEKYPKFIDSIYRSIKLISEEENILKNNIYNYLKLIINDKNAINIDILKKKSIPYIKLIIKYWLRKKYKIIPTYNNLTLVYKEIIKSKKYSKPIIKINKYKYITKFKNHIYCVNNYNEFKKESIIFNNKKLYLSNKFGYIKILKNINYNSKKYIFTMIKEKNINEKIYIKFSCLKNSEKIKILNYKFKEKISKIWNNNNIPYWIRDKIPLIYYDNNLISALNVFITEYGKIDNKNYLYVLWFNSPIKKFLKNIIQ